MNVLDLRESKLIGSIPAEIRKATSLQELILENNFIKGIIPPSLEHCSSLSVLYGKSYTKTAKNCMEKGGQRISRGLSASLPT
ncbi:probably inactive leucine-rich repeat receptor-like protein kinase At3g28040 [Spinacia oleracea]|uniref:Probably inactive leucine-rich repeat receptor-like protein kinase At3g28040 n=1 Tax=Spinacia oleracea TaxID=3562 RepID=A0ABM3RAP7_SPIOL|nr:probably inactive leucine-rich repeat receptor-like protein kinase At3g28040 [Spinacia oleracea]